MSYSSLTENEIRNIIRRRILIEELRYSKSQKLILLEQSGGVTGTVLSIISGAMSMLNPLDDATMAKYIPWAFDAASALITGAGSAAAAAFMPGGLILKTYAFAKVGFYGYLIHNYLVKPFAKETSESYMIHNVFLGRSNTNYVNKSLESLANDITSGRLKMPKLSDDFEAINNLTPASSKADYQKAIASQSVEGVDVTDWVGIPLEKFQVDSTKGYQVIAAFTNTNGGKNGGYAAHATRLVDEALSTQDASSTIIKLSKIARNNGYALRDFQRLDRFVGIELKKRIKAGKIDFSDGGFLSNATGYGHFKCSQAEMEGAIDNSEKSSIYFMCMNFNTLGTAISGMNPLAGKKSYEQGIDDVNDLIEEHINFSELYWPNKFLTINKSTVDGGDFIKNIAPYMGGQSKIDPNSFATEGDVLYLGKKFFKQLELSILEKLQEILKSIKDYAVALWDKFKPTGEALIAGGLTLLQGAWDTLTGIWDDFSSGELNLLELTQGAVEKVFKTIVNGVKALINFFKDKDGLTPDVAKKVTGGTGTSKVGAKKSKGGRTVRGNVKQMQTLLNRYIESTGLDDAPTDADGVWGGDTDRVWQVVINKEFAEGVFKDDPDADIFSKGLTKWPAMSRKLNDETGPKYPDYTPDADGALKIIEDIFQKRIGNFSGGENSSSGSSREGESNAGAGGASNRTGVRDNRGTRGDGGRIERNNIGIEVLAGNNSFDTLEQVGFAEGTSKNISDAVLTAIRSMNHTGGMVTLKINYARETYRRGKERRIEAGEVVSIRRDETQGVARMLNYNSLRERIMTVLSSKNSRVDLSKMDRKERGKRGSFTLVLRIPPGAKRF